MTHLVSIFCNCAYLKVSREQFVLTCPLSLPLHFWINIVVLQLIQTLPRKVQPTTENILIGKLHIL